MLHVHYVVYYRVEDVTQYKLTSKKVTSIMGVAQVVADLHRAGHTVQRWERVTTQAPNKDEERSLQAFLDIAKVPYPK